MDGDSGLKILITNDDGIHSPGLWAAAEALRGAGEIFVVAPDRDQSGVGASLTLQVPIRADEFSPPPPMVADGIKSYSVQGTPGDSCVLALEHLVGPVDLVVSGINQGSNLGEDILISGTVGAALQAYVRDIPSIAISVAAVVDTRYDVAAAFLKMLGGRLVEGCRLPTSLINVNVPNLPPERIAGVQITRLGRRSYGESVTEGNSGRRKYYWVARNRPAHQNQEPDTDVWASNHNRISITPIHTRLTDLDKIPVLEETFSGYDSHLLGRGD